MTDITGRDVAQTLVDVFATSNLADAVRPGEDRRRLKYAGPAALLLYMAAPWVKERFGDLGDLSARDITKKDLGLVAGLAVAGAAAGYYLPERAITQTTQAMSPRTTSAQSTPAFRVNSRDAPEEPVTTPARPPAWLTVASAGYLGLSLWDPSRSDEFKLRQRAGLLGGFGAYAVGPDLVDTVRETLDANHEDYRRRRAVTGAVAAGTGGAMMRYVTR